MPDLKFSVEGAEAVPFAATPMLALKLHIENADPREVIHTVALRVQIQIEATRRRYNASEQEQMLDLFGEPDRWSRTLRSMLWTHASTVVPSFSESTTADLQVPCTFDFNVAATKYFHGLSEGDIPLNLLFSGSIFYADGDRAFQVVPVPWDKEAKFRLPLKVWRDMMDHYYPNSAWLSVHKDVFDRMHQFKMRMGIPTWDQAIEEMLNCVDQEMASR